MLQHGGNHNVSLSNTCSLCFVIARGTCFDTMLSGKMSHDFDTKEKRIQTSLIAVLLAKIVETSVETYFCNKWGLKMAIKKCWDANLVTNVYWQQKRDPGALDKMYIEQLFAKEIVLQVPINKCWDAGSSNITFGCFRLVGNKGQNFFSRQMFLRQLLRLLL